MAATRPGRGRRYLNAGLAALGFVVICALLQAALPFPEIGVVASHLRYFKKHGDEFDTLFVGSSLTHHQISPAIFDRVMAERGHPTRSFNFGVDGMLVAETSYVLERILATRPANLKWVILEFDELETRPFAGAEGSRRDVYWRDWKRTSLVLQKLFEHDQTKSMAFEGEVAVMPEAGRHEMSLRKLLAFHLKLFGKNLANVSRRADLAWWGSHFWKPDKMPDDLGPNGDGWVPLNQDIPEERKPGYRARLDQEGRGRGDRFITRATERAYREMARGIRNAGATPILIGMPVLSQVRLGFRPDSGITASVLSFNDEQTYPGLYRPEMHAEEIHLNHRGSEEFSVLVAQQFAGLLDQKPAR